MESAADLIARLELSPHPEGGWFREVHRATERVDTARGARSALVGPGFEFAEFRFVSSLPAHGEHFSGALAPFVELL